MNFAIKQARRFAKSGCRRWLDAHSHTNTKQAAGSQRE